MWSCFIFSIFHFFFFYSHPKFCLLSSGSFILFTAIFLLFTLVFLKKILILSTSFFKAFLFFYIYIYSWQIFWQFYEWKFLHKKFMLKKWFETFIVLLPSIIYVAYITHQIMILVNHLKITWISLEITSKITFSKTFLKNFWKHFLGIIIIFFQKFLNIFFFHDI